MKIPTLSLSLGAAALLAGSLAFPSASFADSLKERQVKVNDVVAKTRPTVVAILSGNGSGSGVIVSGDGLILTAAHVVDAAALGKAAKASGEVSIVLPDGREVKGKVLGRDRTRDAAMVQILEGKDWPHVELASPKEIKEGEWCIAMGHPGGFDPQRGAPVRVGRLWQTNEKAFYRSDCTVSGGDSGGPLFDLEGKLIGIHSSISMNLTENRHVPAGVFKDDWDRLKKGETWGDARRVLSESNDLDSKGEDKPERRQSKRGPRLPQNDTPDTPEETPSASAKGGAWLGVGMEESDDGVVVTQTAEGSPAAKAGLEVNDVILRVGGKEVGSMGDVASRVRASSPGDKLKLTIKRDGKEKEIEVSLAASPLNK